MDNFLQGDIRALARFISMAENRDPNSTSALASLYSKTGNAKLLGITGPPGAGKSTLCSSLLRHLRKQNKKIAVLTVDPASPFTGGSLLGDRIRLADHFNDPGVYIRSLSTRGKLGGLSLATREGIDLCDAFGFDYVIIETVGVGQNEIDVSHMVDVTLLVLVPEWGDAIQTLKAGIVEIADLFIVNKSDRPGADELANHLQMLPSLANEVPSRVLTASKNDSQAVATVLERVDHFYSAHKKTVLERRKKRTALTLLSLLEREVARQAAEWVEANAKPSENPYAFLESWLKKHPSFLKE